MLFRSTRGIETIEFGRCPHRQHFVLATGLTFCHEYLISLLLVLQHESTSLVHDLGHAVICRMKAFVDYAELTCFSVWLSMITDPPCSSPTNLETCPPLYLSSTMLILLHNMHIIMNTHNYESSCQSLLDEHQPHTSFPINFFRTNRSDKHLLAIAMIEIFGIVNEIGRAHV